MITICSPLFNSTTASTELNDKRAQVLIVLCQSRLPFADIAEALNCRESLVRSLLDRPFRASALNDPPHTITPIDVAMASRTQRSAIQKQPLAPVPEASNVREDLARHLATEIRRWLGTFNLSDAERRQAVEEAGKRLDQSTFYMESNYYFDVFRVSDQILSVWSPRLRSRGEQQFWMRVGQWLAGWIHFWVANPDIWNLALDREFDHYGREAQAA
jgi:hypothetical protein